MINGNEREREKGKKSMHLVMSHYLYLWKENHFLFFLKSRMIWVVSLVENLRPTRSLWGIEDRDRWE